MSRASAAISTLAPSAFSRSTMRAGRRHFGVGVALEQLGRIPAGDAAPGRRRRGSASAPAASRGNLLPSSMPSKPASLRLAQAVLRAACRRRSPACRHSTSRWDWRRCGSWVGSNWGLSFSPRGRWPKAGDGAVARDSHALRPHVLALCARAAPSAGDAESPSHALRRFVVALRAARTPRARHLRHRRRPTNARRPRWSPSGRCR